MPYDPPPQHLRKVERSSPRFWMIWRNSLASSVSPAAIACLIQETTLPTRSEYPTILNIAHSAIYLSKEFCISLGFSDQLASVGRLLFEGSSRSVTSCVKSHYFIKERKVFDITAPAIRSPRTWPTSSQAQVDAGWPPDYPTFFSTMTASIISRKCAPWPIPKCQLGGHHAHRQPGPALADHLWDHRLPRKFKAILDAAADHSSRPSGQPA